MTETEFNSLFSYDISETQLCIKLLIEEENVNLGFIIKLDDSLSMKDLRSLIIKCKNTLINKYLTKDFNKGFEVFSLN